jgi:hypothetical protein
MSKFGLSQITFYKFNSGLFKTLVNLINTNTIEKVLIIDLVNWFCKWQVISRLGTDK